MSWIGESLRSKTRIWKGVKAKTGIIAVAGLVLICESYVFCYTFYLSITGKHLRLCIEHY